MVARIELVLFPLFFPRSFQDLMRLARIDGVKGVAVHRLFTRECRNWVPSQVSAKT